ncbi:hypothetical protein L798_05158 [Zootermopsis nevadensis]|uniref:Uncharacterized protein n=1 Tax=Zootermopsis nevadensis TaxID=136037 RepID=A0A067RAD9_ZOONE|nr:hypothetical protein L798_05158 [Zootermopsis nevadensis]
MDCLRFETRMHLGFSIGPFSGGIPELVGTVRSKECFTHGLMSNRGIHLKPLRRSGTTASVHQTLKWSILNITTVTSQISTLLI